MSGRRTGGQKPTGEQNSSQKTDDETAKKTAIDPTIDDCAVYCFFDVLLV